MKNKEAKQALNDGRQYIEFYKAGFLDGFKSRSKTNSIKNFHDLMRKAFERRFVTFKKKKGKNK